MPDPSAPSALSSLNGPSPHSPGASRPAEVRETHSAVVLLMGEYAYKTKKPVDLGFLDFSTPALREQACRRELAVNRRIAPDVYLGVAEVRLRPAADDADGPGPPPCEHVLVMRRMPDDRRLARLVREGVDVGPDLRRLARIMAAFHTSARTNAEIAACGSPAALEGRWRANLATLDRAAISAPSRDRLDEIRCLALDFVAGRHRLLEARMAAARVRDGHGDLLADDIFCLSDGPRALDALDFDDRLRWMDVHVDDVACLAMDLERLGAPHLADRFLRDYAEFSGTPAPDSLVHHYIAYRAVMRAMVAAIQAAQQGRPLDHPAEPGPSTPEADGLDPVDQLLQIGLDHLRAGQVRLVVVGGGPASGKTTVATAVADRFDLAVLSSDRVRKEMLGIDPESHRPAAFGRGIYRAEVTEHTYECLAEQAGGILAMGCSVVVDATFAAARHRRLLADVATRTHTAATWVRCRPPDAVVAARLRQRARRLDPSTDADAAVAARLARQTDPWPGATDLDTSRPVGDCVDAVAALW